MGFQRNKSLRVQVHRGGKAILNRTHFFALKFPVERGKEASQVPATKGWGELCYDNEREAQR